jgi:hypothetical protein
MPKEEKRNWKERLVEELKGFAVSVIYIWFFLSVLSLHRGIILSEHNIGHSFWGELALALVNALILGKFVVIAKALHAGERLEDHPLLYSILFKSAVFAAILMACHILEEWLVRIWHGGSAAGLPTLNETLPLGVVAFVALIPFFTAKELVRVVGKDELKSLLLRRRTNTLTLPSKSAPV